DRRVQQRALAVPQRVELVAVLAVDDREDPAQRTEEDQRHRRDDDARRRASARDKVDDRRDREDAGDVARGGEAHTNRVRRERALRRTSGASASVLTDGSMRAWTPTPS